MRMVGMELTKDTVQKWLDSIGKDRNWLAEELGSTYLTINQYMSKGFPRWAAKQVERLMNPEAMELQFTDREFDLILEAMRIGAYTSRKAFYQDAIVDQAQRVIANEEGPSKIIRYNADEKDEPHSIVAEGERVSGS